MYIGCMYGVYSQGGGGGEGSQLPLKETLCVVFISLLSDLKSVLQDDIGSIDWSVEPAVLISPDYPYFHVKRYSESDFDSQTLLDYLGPSTSDLNTTVTPLQILSTDQDTVDGDSPQETCEQKQLKLEELCQNKHQTNCYNVSVESGVVLDADSHVNVRKISTGSAGSCSQGSSHDIFEHSYIGMADNDVCACMECRQQRERLYSKRTGCRTLVTSKSNKLGNNSTTCTLDGNLPPKNSDKLQCHTTELEDNQPMSSIEQCHTNDTRPRDAESPSHCHETGSNIDRDTTKHTSNVDAVHCTALNLNIQQPTHTDNRSHRDSKDD